MTTSPRVTAKTGLRPFGGSRIAAQSQAVLWSDGIVLTAAWADDPSPLGSFIFNRRLQITRSPSYWSGRPTWTLREEDGTCIDTFPTRTAALERADQITRLDLFRALNAAEAAA